MGEEATFFQILEGSIQYGKRSHRAPFKVNCITISPANDLIAIGSKNGDIVVKRSSWKQIWKLNLSNMGTLGRQLTKLATIESLAFSPDGEILVVGTNLGLLHIIDVETGLYKHTSKIGKGECDPSIDRLRWCNHNTTNEMLLSNENHFVNAVIQNADKDRKTVASEPLKSDSALYDKCMNLMSQKPDVAQEDIAFVFQMLEEDSTVIKADDGVEETMENAFITNKKYRASLQNTILLAIRDDLIVTVVLAGVMPLMDININEQCSKFNLSVIMVYDAFYSRPAGGVSIVATTHGARPWFGESGKFGEYISGGERSNNTNILNFKLEITDRMWDLALRYIRLIYGYTLMSISFDTLRKSWDAQMMSLMERFDTGTTNVRIGDLLIDMVLSGSTDSTGEAFLERGMGVEGLNGIRDFCEKTLTDTGRIVRGQFTNAIRNIAFQVTEFNSCMRSILRENHYKTQADYLLQTSFNNSASHSYVQNQPFDNQYMQILERDAARLEYKTKQLVLECSIMLQEISHLWRWMSMMKPFAKNLKTNMLLQSKRMDIKQLMRFIVDTFVTDETAKMNYENVMFNLKHLLNEMRKEEEENGFDELKYVEEAKIEAEKLHREFLKELRSLRPEVMEYTGTRGDFTAGLKADQKGDVALSVSDRTFDLDRVGSFLRMELTDRAKQKLPYCNDLLMGINDLKMSGARSLDADARHYGLERIVCDFANAILSSHHALGEQIITPNSNLSLQWGFEIDSSLNHYGFENVFITNIVKEDSMAGELIRGLHVCCCLKTILISMVVLPPISEKLRDSGKKEGELIEYRRLYDIEKCDPIVKEAKNCEEVTMEVDENAGQGIRIDIDEMNMRKYNRLIEYDMIYPALDGDIIIMGKFNSTIELNSGVIRRMIYVKSKKNDGGSENWMIQSDLSASIEVIEKSLICADVSRGIYLYDDATRVAVFSLKEGSEENVEIDDGEVERGGRKAPTYRDFQVRRDRIRKVIPMSYTRPPTAQKIDLLAEEMIDDPSAEMEFNQAYY